MAVWFDALEVTVGLVALAFCSLLVWRGTRTITAFILAAWLFSLGMFYIIFGIGSHIGLSPSTVTFLSAMVSFPRPFLVAAFGLLYLRPVVGLVVRSIVAGLVVMAVALTGVVLTATSLFLTPDGSWTPLLNLYFVLSFASFVVTVGLLGWRWATTPSGHYRAQLLWGLLPFLFWTIHDSIGFVLVPLVLGAQSSRLLPFSISEPLIPAALLASIGILIVATLAVVAVRRMVAERDTARDARILFFIAIYSVPLSLVQLFDAGFHLAVDILIIPILAYGIVRHQVVDLDLRLRWTLKKGTTAGFVLAVFFIISEATVEFFSVDAGLGRWLGIAAGGLLLFALSPLQGVAERVSSLALPHTVHAGDHIALRKRDIYRVAAEELLSDGALTEKERAVLVRLRGHLDMDPVTAAGIEDDVARLLGRA